MLNLEPTSFVDRQEILNDFGKLTVLEFSFPVRRIYLINNLVENSQRGSHAHKKLRQIFLVISGSFTIEVSTPLESKSFQINENSPAIQIPPAYWRVLRNLSSNLQCLVLASDHYNASDYIHDFKDYASWFMQEYQC